MSGVAEKLPAVARLVADLKERGGLTGRDIANIVDVSQATVTRWSKGIGAPSIQRQAVIAAHSTDSHDTAQYGISNRTLSFRTIH